MNVSGGSSNAGQLLELARQFFRVIPHSEVLGMEPVDVGADWVTARMPYREEMVGNPSSGVVHGGVITTLVDQTSGAAVIAALGGREAVATLDLRIDHMRPAKPGMEILARGECYRVSSDIAFARCVVYQADPGVPVATSMGTFMRVPSRGPGMVEGAA